MTGFTPVRENARKTKTAREQGRHANGKQRQGVSLQATLDPFLSFNFATWRFYFKLRRLFVVPCSVGISYTKLLDTQDPKNPVAMNVKTVLNLSYSIFSTRGGGHGYSAIARISYAAAAHVGFVPLNLD